MNNKLHSQFKERIPNKNKNYCVIIDSRFHEHCDKNRERHGKILFDENLLRALCSGKIETLTKKSNVKCLVSIAES